MSTGLSSRFNILQQSPLDHTPSAPVETEESVEPGTPHWLPSRFNIRARTEDGSLVLWNSYRGTMSVFGPEQRETIEQMISRQGFSARAEGLVKYLFDRGFLIQEDTDEYRRLRMAFGHQHYRTDRLELILLSSEDCNFRCTYCYEDFNRGTMEPWVRQGVKKLVERRLPSLRSLQTSWFGGEPLYGMDAIEELAPYFVETAERHSLRLNTHMTTNGYLLTPGVAEKLLRWQIRSFQITLDGPAKTHDCSRPTRDGQGTFQVILDNLRALREFEETFLVDLRVNFDRDNRDSVPELMTLLEEEFSSDPRFKLRFRAVGQWGGPNDADLNVCGVDESRDAIHEFKEEARKRGLSLADGVREVKGLGAQVCYAARPFNFIVGADGKLMKCTIDLDKKDRNIVGQLNAEGEIELDQDKFALWTEPAFESDKKCQKCVVLPVCQGMHCPQIRFDYDRSPCTSLRMEAKRELRATWAEGTGKERKVAAASAPVVAESTDARSAVSGS
jgi:uncharacterized protein